MKIECKPNTNGPTAVITPFDNKNIEIRLFGRNSGLTDWSIAPLGIIAADAEFLAYRRISINAAAVDVTTLYAPAPSTFNAVICRHVSLLSQRHERIINKEPVPVYGVSIMSGVDADGCNIPKGCGFWISSADCPTIVAYSPDTGIVIAAHAGRNCLFDTHLLRTGKPGRQHASVVDAIIAKFLWYCEPIKNLRIFITCGIGCEYFKHDLFAPVYASFNRALAQKVLDMEVGCAYINGQYLHLALRQIIMTQFRMHGVPDAQMATDSINTYSDRDALSGEYLWWSYERAQTEDLRLKRNGVMVINR